MLPNPSQGIKDYSINDVYTPGDSNARRERIPFDFVITDRQLQAFKTANPELSTIRLGELIVSTASGELGNALEELIDHTISIYIDAETSEEDCFDCSIAAFAKVFTYRMLRWWADGADGDTAVHIYSRKPYSVPNGLGLTGGVAYHSTPNAFVKFGEGAGNSPGIVRVGVFKHSGVDLGVRPGFSSTQTSGLSLWYEHCLNSSLPRWEPTDSTYASGEPAIACVPWMSATALCTLRVSEMNLPQTIAGLYTRIHKSLGSGATVQLLVTGGITSKYFQLLRSKGSISTTASYVFRSDNQQVTVTAEDEVSIEDVDTPSRTPTLVKLSKIQLIRDGANLYFTDNVDLRPSVDSDTLAPYAEQIAAILGEGNVPSITFWDNGYELEPVLTLESIQCCGWVFFSSWCNNLHVGIFSTREGGIEKWVIVTDTPYPYVE